MKRLLLWAPFLFFAHFTAAQERVAAFEMNERLGRGINMGNAFEAPSETAWGNPWKPEYFEMMAEMGFQHVRLPVRWETSERSLAAAPYTIEPAFLARIQEVVDHALAHDLIIIFNMHHHELLFDDPQGQKERFLSQWGQIAEYFKDYPEELIFEVLNEPHGNLTPALWNEFFADALEVIRETNPDRFVLMGTADFGGLSGLPYLELPDDENIIVSVHYYNPFSFTHQGAEWVGDHADEWLGTEWKDTEAERETVASEFAAAFAFSEEQNIPIHVGEFGAYSTADLESRVRWTTFLARWFEEQNLSWAYWEFSAGFGIYNPATDQVLEPLLDALLHNEMPEPLEIEAIEIYKSNFTNGADGWILQVQAGLDANLDAAEGSLRISINNGGTEAWHVQLMKGSFLLEEEKMYRISVTASAGAAQNVTMYVGKASDPWTAYSGYISLGLSSAETVFRNTFTMDSPTDTEARIVFDLGNTTGNVEIVEVILEEIRIVEPGDGDEDEDDEDNEIPTSALTYRIPSLRYYPNPVRGNLHLSNVQKYSNAVLFDMYGRKLEAFRLLENEALINLEKYASGQYIIMLEGSSSQTHLKILKQ